MGRIPFIFLLLLISGLSFAQPEPCGSSPNMESTCLDACVICDIDGFTGTNNLTAQGQTFPGFCTTMFHNMSYIAFIAGTTDLSISVTVDNCTTNWGVEIGFFQSDDCVNFNPVTFCNTDVAPNTTVTFSNDIPLVIGQHYYLIMDGSNADICDWTFNVISGSTQVSDLTTSGVISGEPQTCPDFPTTYTTTGDDGAALFFWTIDGVQQSEQSQTTDLVFPADGTYEVCVTAANACDQAAPSCTIVNVITPGTLNLTEVICDNDCYDVAGQTICQTGIYDFVITLENGCDSLIFLDLTVLPQAQEFIDINLCQGEAFLIGNTPYTTTGIFMDTIQTSLECDSIVNLDLFIIECNIVGSTDFVEPICNGEANGFLIFSVENGTPPFSYDWSNILEPSIGGVGTTSLFDNNMVANVPAGTYEININDDFGNQTVLFQDVSEPSLLGVNPSAVDINGFNLSCNGGSDGTAMAQGFGGVAPYTYAWSDATIGNEATSLSAGLYTISISDSYGCVQSNQITLEEPDPIGFNVFFTDPNCDGFETGRIELDSIVGGTPPYTYAITGDTFSMFPIYRGLGPGLYEFTVRDNNDCEVSISEQLTPPDIPVLFLGDDLDVNLGCPIEIQTITNNTNLIDIQWSNGSTMDCDTCLRPFASPVDRTQYVLSVTSADTCSTMDTIVVNVIKIRDLFVPNAFSPNGDGVNDVFFINAYKSIDYIKSWKILGRWGEVVYGNENFAPNDPTNGWDGRLKDKLLDPGVYIWVAEVVYLDGYEELVSGDVTLLR